MKTRQHAHVRTATELSQSLLTLFVAAVQMLPRARRLAATPTLCTAQATSA